jgi:hypothetical protein
MRTAPGFPRLDFEGLGKDWQLKQGQYSADYDAFKKWARAVTKSVKIM